MTELLYLVDAYVREFSARVVAVGDDEVQLDRTAFYVTGGGQPHDTGTLAFGGPPEEAGAATGPVTEAPGPSADVIDVRKEGDQVWHRLRGPVPAVGELVVGTIDWDRRHALMRTHTALHVLCGVIWNAYEVPVTGGNMEPLAARMDFEFDPLPEGFGPHVEKLVNEELARDRPIEVSFLPRHDAVLDRDLIRTKISLVPEHVAEVRVVDIVGLDKQADGGTHVHSTGEVGRIRVVKTESKGKGNKRIRLEVLDA